MAAATPDAIPPDGHALLDFGDDRRLEQWGPIRVVRPDPRASGSPILPTAAWDAADAAFVGRLGQGTWKLNSELPSTWTIAHGGAVFEVRLAPSMHIGLFPEQALHWDWLVGLASRAGRPLSVLNLFAYTGGASIVLAKAGHQVTHVDASQPALSWARRNAALNGVSSVRWLQDDARQLVERMHRRGRRFDAVLLDPPQFGRGPGGTWRLARDLNPLLRGVTALLADAPAFLLVNTYGLDQTPHWLRFAVEDALGSGRPDLQRQVDADILSLRAVDGRSLPTGVFARWRPTR